MAKSETELQFEARQMVYTTAAELHRYFLSWRNQLLAGYFAVVAAIAVAYHWAYTQPHHSVAWILIVGCFAFAITLFFFLLEMRNRQLYRECQNVEQDIELTLKLAPTQKAPNANLGLYDRLITNTGQTFNHSNIMSLFFAGALISIIALVIVTLLKLK